LWDVLAFSSLELPKDFFEVVEPAVDSLGFRAVVVEVCDDKFGLVELHTALLAHSFHRLVTFRTVSHNILYLTHQIFKSLFEFSLSHVFNRIKKRFVIV
jgi:hypothetical protein